VPAGWNSLKPYVVRIVSPTSGQGKTRLASELISRLKIRGALVAAVKHALHGVGVEDKDSHVMIRSGADVVAASSPRLGIVYYSKGWADDLEHIASILGAPIVVAEGFKESGVGDAVVVSKTPAESLELAEKVKPVAIVVWSTEPQPPQSFNPPAPVFSFRGEDLDRLADLVYSKAVEFLDAQTGRADCGYCGYPTCRAFTEAYIRGEARLWCPVASDVKLSVDGKPIPLNPFVKNALRSTINGFLDSLKGVPQHRKRVVIEFEL